MNTMSNILLTIEGHPDSIPYHFEQCGQEGDRIIITLRETTQNDSESINRVFLAIPIGIYPVFIAYLQSSSPNKKLQSLWASIQREVFLLITSPHNQPVSYMQIRLDAITHSDTGCQIVFHQIAIIVPLQQKHTELTNLKAEYATNPQSSVALFVQNIQKIEEMELKKIGDLQLPINPAEFIGYVFDGEGNYVFDIDRVLSHVLGYRDRDTEDGFAIKTLSKGDQSRKMNFTIPSNSLPTLLDHCNRLEIQTKTLQIGWHQKTKVKSSNIEEELHIRPSMTQ